MEKSANNTGNQTRTMANTTTNYNATRTSTNPTFMGMSGTAWTWLIIGIAAIAIIALVWYYSMQVTNNNHHDRHD